MAEVTPEQEVKDWESKLGKGSVPTQSITNLIGMEVGAERGRKLGAWANDQYDAFQGAWIPTNLDEDQFLQVTNAVDAWARNTDYRAIPSWQHIVDMYENKVDVSDPQAVAQYLSQFLPPDKKRQMPWASSGMSGRDFNSQIRSWYDSYIGPADAKELGDITNKVSAAMASGSDMTQALDQLQRDPAVQAKYGWIKYNKTYDQFQQMKTDPNQQQMIISRFGAAAVASDEAYLQQLGTPQASGGGGRAIQAQSQRTQQNLGGLSEVR